MDTNNIEGPRLRRLVCAAAGCGNDDPLKFQFRVQDSAVVARCMECGDRQEVGPCSGHQAPVGRTEVTHISQLKPGDHVSWKRRLGYCHHGIVVDLDVRSGQLKVVHWAAGLSRKLAGRVLVEEWLDFDGHRSMLYRQDYDDCLDDEEVVRRARSRIGETAYSLMANNCEHFAVWCKTGVAASKQVSDALRSIQQTTEAVISARRPSSRRRLSVRALVGAEAVSACRDVGAICRLRRDRRISGDELIRASVERLAGGVGAVVGAVAGGRVVPVEVPVGGRSELNGCTLASLLGRYAGKVAGRTAAGLLVERRPNQTKGRRPPAGTGTASTPGTASLRRHAR